MDGISLAASVVALVGLVKSMVECLQKINNFKSRFRSAAVDIEDLIRDAKNVYSILQLIEDGGNHIGEANIDRRVREMWNTLRPVMKRDFDKVLEFVHHLRIASFRSGSLSTIVRLKCRIAFARETIKEHREKMSKYLFVLGFMHSLFNKYAHLPSQMTP